MGSRSNVELAYIAGFLDGDGSIMVQIKTRRDTRRGARFMATLCFYQDTRHAKHLSWIRDVFGVGYIARRNDGMTELRINGFATVLKILLLLSPHIRFKEEQARLCIQACEILTKKKISELSKSELHKLVNISFAIKDNNYKSSHALTKKEVLHRLDLTP